MNKRGKRWISLAVALTMIGGNVLAVSAADIDQVQKEAEQLEQQKDSAVAEQNALSEQLNAIITDMQATQDQLSQKEAEIEQAENDLVNAKVEENTQYESMKKRIRYMYENGNTEFIEILISAKNISDFLNKAEYVTKISEYDREMLDEFQAVVKQVEEKEAQLRNDYTELETLQTQLVNQQETVQSLLSEKNMEIANLESAIGEKSAQLQKLIEEAKAAEERKRQQEEALRQQQQQASQNQPSQGSNSQGNSSQGSSSQGNTGGGSYTPPGNNVVSGSGTFTHPCPSGHVSSGFGYRDFDSSHHNGVDFGTSGAYVPTYAAAAGRVMIAGWSNSAGNWVVIDHGNGLVTKYMHHSSLSVSAGQYVEKGQQIGVTGNTGNSFGVHLHFQVEQNGKVVNPFNYL